MVPTHTDTNSKIKLAAITPDVSVLVTGATGFIGHWLVESLLACGAHVYALVRDVDAAKRVLCDRRVTFVVGDITDPLSLKGACNGMDILYHLAGYAHTEDATSSAGESLHRTITVEGTRALLASALSGGVKKIVFVSSVKAMGEGGAVCLDEASPVQPEGVYGAAKLAAEGFVLQAGKENGRHACVLRLPLVYGRDNKGNLPRMIAAIDRGRFPPLPEVRNRRSMVHVDDVVQALLLAADRPQANGKTYLVTDGRQYSAREIYLEICRALGRPVPRWTVPAAAMRQMAIVGDFLGHILPFRVPFNSEVYGKLLGSACYRSDRIGKELGYVPRHNLASALPEMIARHRKSAIPKNSV